MAKIVAAKVTTEFSGRPDSESLSRPIVVGEIITGDLARLALEQKWAEPADAAAAPPARDDTDAAADIDRAEARAAAAAKLEAVTHAAADAQTALAAAKTPADRKAAGDLLAQTKAAVDAAQAAADALA